MAINKNHEFEELDGIKCGVVEKNVSPQRMQFLKTLLEYNRFVVVAIPTPAPKAAAKAAPVEGAEATEVVAPPTPPLPETFTLGVTDYTFNVTNALYGRALKTPDGHVVTVAYWYQQENVSHDEVPYFEFKG